MPLKGKRILIGITGGIAAYKTATLIRLLKKQGAEVRCMMTSASSDFITPLTISTLSENPVGLEFYNPKTGEWTNHVEWALWADLMLIAPATANSMAGMVHGFADNFLLATYLSRKSPVMIAPAMDLDMYANPVTQRNIAQLEKDGALVIPAESGELASGLTGQGRMAEPETILKHVEAFFCPDGTLSGKTFLITAGPTYEAIDPVRFIGNHSSGKMGFELAKAALARGARVIVISGPGNLSIDQPAAELHRVQSADEMLEAVKLHWDRADAGIFAAAVADYRPETKAPQKIKKSEDELTIRLVKNPDILSWASANRNNGQKVIGFALETVNGEAYAREKLAKKNTDAIVLNEMSEPGVGFGGDTNKVSLILPDNKIVRFELQSKSAVAASLIDSLTEIFR
jgi:phosphopantothenoylcysteine decarboxylase / phosphopantothenate---cysteine ligase